MPIDCYECRGLGDDYYIDADGEWVSAYDGCTNNEQEMLDDPDHCYECPMDENDYYITDNGEKVYWCDTCPFNQSDEETKQEVTGDAD